MNLPNKLTVFRIILIPVFMLLLIFSKGSAVVNTDLDLTFSWVLAAIVFAVACITDFLDGQIARRKYLVTNFGKFFDPLADKLLVMTALIYLTAFHQVSAWVTAVIVIRELAVTGLRTLVVENNGTVMSAAWPGKIKTFSQMFAIFFLYLKDWPFAIVNFPIGQVLLYIAVFFTIYSGIEYFWKSRAVFADGL
ncbi:CDP-diacylglycerol--glycerol-3-phosphate 3-phosphatidyltransferase [Fructobacillus cardui]|uniref:CDP-diacylglycerol--glycerol-3-phosphate 3-phosphatidyltransferase n=1 Tax=Fructobacillus cardui TaxID=2893170 RepID=UPI00200A6897|nr:CDP-diacylglycerol--glycerol-3-phosphate 3-phosphatidyltransferase [Fructobacillus cardui]MCK8627428.1 CDP-diacylglycerol--glycerol-3-phosphate 3-phosphatidyltransferase [Fructobacillus cardui]